MITARTLSRCRRLSLHNVMSMQWTEMGSLVRTGPCCARLEGGTVRAASCCFWTGSWTVECNPETTSPMAATLGCWCWMQAGLYGPSMQTRPVRSLDWRYCTALDDSERTFAHLTHSIDAMLARGARCVLVGDLNLVAGADDVLALSAPHVGGLELFASLCEVGHMRDAMLPELVGTGVLTNRCGAGRLLPAESQPFGSCTQLDHVLVLGTLLSLIGMCRMRWTTVPTPTARC